MRGIKLDEGMVGVKPLMLVAKAVRARAVVMMDRVMIEIYKGSKKSPYTDLYYNISKAYEKHRRKTERRHLIF